MAFIFFYDFPQHEPTLQATMGDKLRHLEVKNYIFSILETFPHLFSPKQC